MALALAQALNQATASPIYRFSLFLFLFLSNSSYKPPITWKSFKSYQQKIKTHF